MIDDDARQAGAEPECSGEERRRPSSVDGLIGIVVAFVAIATLFALEQPPFFGVDESAHLGYAHAVAALRLPDIDDIPPVPRDASQWIAEREAAESDRYRTVWVANHPPLHYALVAPLVRVSMLRHQADGGLVMLRLANVAFAAAGIVMTYVLTLELTRGLSRVALAAAGIAAFTTQGFPVFSLALNDGLGFAAGTVVLWAGLRCVQGGVHHRNLVILGSAVTLAAGTRASTMLLGMAVVGFVATVELCRSGASRHERLWAAARACCAGLLPAAVVFGWFYARNVRLYGDVAGSRALMDRFGRSAHGTFWSIAVDGERWLLLYHRLMAPATTTAEHPWGMVVVGIAATTGLLLAFVTRRAGDHHDDGSPAHLRRDSLLLLCWGIAVVAATYVQHVSVGGSMHPRYVFPALGAIAALTAVGVDRLVPRVLPTVLVFGMATWTLLQLPIGVDPLRVRRQRDATGLAPEALRVLPGDPFWRALAGTSIVVGCGIAAVVMLLGLRPVSSARPVDRA